MPKATGRAMLLKMEVNSTDTLIATINAKTLVINNQPIDVTTPDADDPDGDLWQETLNGLKSMAISGDGRFNDSAAEVALANLALADKSIGTFQVVVPNFGTYEGSFLLESFEFGGEAQGPLTFSISLTSAGKPTFSSE
ncbi:MAG: phage major tail protein, TP901-1 family [Gammaproteobacteria bacterium]|nr:phage major tail protein, TP901-1 family [Gammaproteobacteria bacterium]